MKYKIILILIISSIILQNNTVEYSNAKESLPQTTVSIYPKVNSIQAYAFVTDTTTAVTFIQPFITTTSLMGKDDGYRSYFYANQYNYTYTSLTNTTTSIDHTIGIYYTIDVEFTLPDFESISNGYLYYERMNSAVIGVNKNGVTSDIYFSIYAYTQTSYTASDGSATFIWTYYNSVNVGYSEYLYPSYYTYTKDFSSDVQSISGMSITQDKKILISTVMYVGIQYDDTSMPSDQYLVNTYLARYYFGIDEFRISLTYTPKTSNDEVISTILTNTTTEINEAYSSIINSLNDITSSIDLLSSLTNSVYIESNYNYSCSVNSELLVKNNFPNNLSVCNMYTFWFDSNNALLEVNSHLFLSSDNYYAIKPYHSEGEYTVYVYVEKGNYSYYEIIHITVISDNIQSNQLIELLRNIGIILFITIAIFFIIKKYW